MILIDKDKLGLSDMEIVMCNGDYKEALKMLIDKIERAPTIEERKTGKWIRHYSRPNVYADLCWHCSCCNYKTPDNWANKWNFCPNCGAEMENEQ